MIEVRPFDESTLQDALEILHDRFGGKIDEIVQRELSNPLRKIASSIGWIGYDDGVPTCLIAYALRFLYRGKNRILGKVSAVSCIKQGAPVESFIDVRAADWSLPAGSVIAFANSMNAQSAASMRRVLAACPVPVSCSRYLWRAIRPVRCAQYFFRRKVLKLEVPSWQDVSTLGSSGFQIDMGGFSFRRLMSVEPDFFDVLMDDYVTKNEGVVSSRRAEDLDWLFADRIQKGRCVLLGAFQAGRPAGYVIVKSTMAGRRWRMLDWFALRNDPRTLESLLGAVCFFLRKHTPAIMVETFGFPTYIQPLLKRYLPHERPVGHSMSYWSSSDKDLGWFSQIIDASQSWFFGPYDGDICFA